MGVVCSPVWRKDQMNLPDVLEKDTTPENWNARREALLTLFRTQEYGVRPDVPYVQTERLVREEALPECNALRQIWKVQLETKYGSLAFPVVLVRPAGEQKVPAVLFLCNHEKTASPSPKMGLDQMEKLMTGAPESWCKETMDIFRNMPKGSGGPSLINIETETEQEYWPAAQIVQSGRAAVTFYASALQPDDAAQYPGPLAKLFGMSGENLPEDAWGTLGIWAFGMSCAVDLLEKHPGIDPARISVGGFSRGGKAALWCAAQDTRVNGVLVNDSGCSGAAVSRGKHGETVGSITAAFPHWFCKNYRKYAWKEDRLPFDQHQLVACVAPRLCYVTSGSEDRWSDPDAEWRGAREASCAWELFGDAPLPAQPPANDTGYQTGRLGCHRRTGGHDLTRWDWAMFLHFLERHNG